MKILIIEDNNELRENMESYLTQEGFLCELAESKSAAMDKLTSFLYDIILLDIMLPDGSGMDILSHIKSRGIKSGVLIISGKDSMDDKIQGLDYGADDYITKPFFLPELNARIKSIYRRKKFDGDNLIRFEEITINPETREAKVNMHLLEFTRKEYELLVYFIANKNRILTKQAIAEHLWGDFADSLDSHDFVYQHIKNLRKKITNAGGADYLSTIYGMGYKFSTEQ
ncbi:response regulator transcription factor [Reichenbachiella sp. MALMAid0571]|uniref:response regulator transcription factor n=1 Tax=Reichenbachiella sp. MALMAid0571 TaxID=3143939 RepID=UPI0032DFCFB7